MFDTTTHNPLYGLFWPDIGTKKVELKYKTKKLEVPGDQNAVVALGESFVDLVDVAAVLWRLDAWEEHSERGEACAEERAEVLKAVVVVVDVLCVPGAVAEVFNGGLVRGDQVQRPHHKEKHNHRQRRAHREAHHHLVHSGPQLRPRTALIHQHPKIVQTDRHGRGHHTEPQIHQKQHKIFVIIMPNALVDPWTVVVHLKHAVAT